MFFHPKSLVIKKTFQKISARVEIFIQKKSQMPVPPLSVLCRRKLKATLHPSLAAVVDAQWQLDLSLLARVLAANQHRARAPTVTGRLPHAPPRDHQAHLAIDATEHLALMNHELIGFAEITSCPGHLSVTVHFPLHGDMWFRARVARPVSDASVVAIVGRAGPTLSSHSFFAFVRQGALWIRSSADDNFYVMVRIN